MSLENTKERFASFVPSAAFTHLEKYIADSFSGIPTSKVLPAERNLKASL